MHARGNYTCCNFGPGKFDSQFIIPIRMIFGQIPKIHRVHACANNMAIEIVTQFAEIVHFSPGTVGANVNTYDKTRPIPVYTGPTGTR